jgi:NAD(P)H-dependent FMN reductase
MGPHITVIAGSPRERSFSGRLSRHVAGLLHDPVGAGEVDTIDLGRTPPPQWCEDLGREGHGAGDSWRPVSAALRRSDGFVLVVPEWGGMAPPVVKNLFLLCDGTFELADKPALLVGVSSGSGGAFPLGELRMSSYKNTRICYIPEQVVVREVGALFEGDSFVESPEAKRLEAQLVHALRLLVRYAEALSVVRTSGVRDVAGFPWNMS